MRRSARRARAKAKRSIFTDAPYAAYMIGSHLWYWRDAQRHALKAFTPIEPLAAVAEEALSSSA